MATQPEPAGSETPPAPTEPTGSESGATPNLEAEVEKWKKHSREQEARAKANADAAKKLAELEESQKSESQKLSDKAATAETRAAALELENARLRVALKHGLTADQARRLIGDSEEELDADAETLLASLTPAGDPPPTQPQTAPREKLRTGATASTPGLGDDKLTQDLKRKLGIA